MQAIEPAQTEWASPVIFILKKDRDVWFCAEYKKVNVETLRDSYLLAQMDKKIYSLGNAKIFSTLDGNSG